MASTGRCRPSPSGEAHVLGGSSETGLQSSCVHRASPGQQDRTARGAPSAHPGTFSGAMTLSKRPRKPGPDREEKTVGKQGGKEGRKTEKPTLFSEV